MVHISDRQGISLSYLEQLFSRLRRQQLVASFRGPGGGYKLGRGASQISIADVMFAVNESIDTTRCQKQGDCQGGETCLTHHLWMDLSEQLEDFLSGISLGDLMHRHNTRTELLATMPTATANAEGSLAPGASQASD